MTEGEAAVDDYGVAEPQTIRRRTADGVDLAADVYRPVGDGPFPVMLMRQPYGRRIASTVVLAHPAWYAAKGYIVAVEDVRGRGDSGGAFRVLADEPSDGAGALEFAADMSGADGRVATYGFSYQGISQFLALAGSRGKRPDAMVPAMAAWSIRNDWAYEGGAFRLALNQGWACQMAAETARRSGDAARYAAFTAAANRGTHDGPVPARPPLLSEAAPHYRAWLGDRSEAWSPIDPASLLAGDPLDIPALHVGGWLDFMLTGTLGSHAAFAANGPRRQRLLVGPWLHLPWSRLVGELDLGPAAVSTVDRETVAFLDHVLKDRGDPGPGMRLFDIGERRWRDLEIERPIAEHRLHLISIGLAAVSSTDGALAADPGRTAVDRIVHDPWRPAPLHGGHLPPFLGYLDRAAVDERSDVACYTTLPLSTPVTIDGAAWVALSAGCDRPSYDLCCVLSIVFPDGRVIALTSGYLRVADSLAPGNRAVVMRRTYCTVPAGAALRLSVQAAGFPAFAVNPGTGVRPEDASVSDAVPVTVAIMTGGASQSCLCIPLADAAPTVSSNLPKS